MEARYGRGNMEVRGLGYVRYRCGGLEACCMFGVMEVLIERGAAGEMERENARSSCIRWHSPMH
jgi:hypothetical protein